MKHQTRLIAKGFVGIPDPPALTFNVDSNAALAKQKQRGQSLKNLRHLSISPGQAAQIGGAGIDDSGGRLVPLIFDYQLVFPESWNLKTNWAPNTFLDELTTAFRRGPAGAIPSARRAIQHSSGAASSYVSTSLGAQVDENGAFALRFQLYSPDVPSNSAAPVWIARVGQSTRQWQFRIFDGQAAMMRLTPAWTQAKEQQLITLLWSTTRSDAQQATADTLQAQIYADYCDLDLGISGEDWYNTPRCVVFIPEPCGRIHVALEGGSAQAVDDSEILATRANGVIWGASAITIKADAGSYFLQAGYPYFNPTGQWKLGIFKDDVWRSVWHDDVYNASKFEPAGTAITFSKNEIDDYFSEIVINFSTSDRRKTPFFYWLSTLIEAGPRSGSTEPVLDTDDHLDNNGVSPILEADMTFEGGDDFVLRRSSIDLELRDVNGELLTGVGAHYAALENRLCDLYIDGNLYLKNALVKNSSITTLRAATPNQSRVQITLPETRLHLGLCDLWGIIDEMPLPGDFIGDDLRLGYYLRLILRCAGFSDAEMAGISATSGRKLPKSAFGETPCVRPGEGVTIGDSVRSLLEKYGKGWTLWISESGAWTFGQRDTSIKAAFTTNKSSHRNKTYPGRWHVLYPLDFTRDFTDFFNIFTVQGAPDPITGIPITRSGAIEESLQLNEFPPALSHVGRPKPYPTVVDEGLRTVNEVLRALRSVMKARGRLGRFVGFETYFHRALRIGDRVTVDGRICELVRITSASLAADRMTLVLQEVV